MKTFIKLADNGLLMFAIFFTLFLILMTLILPFSEMSYFFILCSIFSFIFFLKELIVTIKSK